MSKKIDLGETLKNNLSILMERDSLSETGLAKRAKVAQKTVNNIMNLRSTPTLDVLTRLAQALNVTPWLLIMPDLPSDMLRSHEAERLLRSYIDSNNDGRELILHVSERESRYAAERNQVVSNQMNTEKTA